MKLLKSIYKFVRNEGRLPKARDCDDSTYLKSAGVYIREFGSWSDTLDVFVATLVDKNIKLKKKKANPRPSPQDNVLEEKPNFAEILKPREVEKYERNYLSMTEALAETIYKSPDYYRENYDPKDMAKILNYDMNKDGWEGMVRIAFDEYMFDNLSNPDDI